MLYAVLLKLRAAHAAELPPTTGHQAHGLFLRLIQSADPQLSKRLHDRDERKPFTVSGVRSTAARGQESAAERDAELHLRVTLLGDELVGPFLEPVLRQLGYEVDLGAWRLGDLSVSIKGVIGRRDEYPVTGRTDFGTLLKEASTDRQVELSFVSPTAFSLGRGSEGRRRMELMPLPGLVFGSLLSKWNEFAPDGLYLDPEWRSVVEDACVAAEFSLRTERFRFPRHVQAGCVGSCRYEVMSDDRDTLRLVNTLADFAFYAGVGYKTTMGMGQARRPVSDRAGS